MNECWLQNFHEVKQTVNFAQFSVWYFSVLLAGPFLPYAYIQKWTLSKDQDSGLRKWKAFLYMLVSNVNYERKEAYRHRSSHDAMLHDCLVGFGQMLYLALRAYYLMHWMAMLN